MKSIFKRLGSKSDLNENREDGDSEVSKISDVAEVADIALVKLRVLKDFLREMNLGVHLISLTNGGVTSLDDLDRMTEEMLLGFGLKKAHCVKIRRGLMADPWAQSLSERVAPTAAKPEEETIVLTADEPTVISFETRPKGETSPQAEVQDDITEGEDMNGLKKVDSSGPSNLTNEVDVGTILKPEGEIATEEDNNSWNEAEKVNAAMEFFSRVDCRNTGRVSQAEMMEALSADMGVASALGLSFDIRQSMRGSATERFNYEVLFHSIGGNADSFVTRDQWFQAVREQSLAWHDKSNKNTTAVLKETNDEVRESGNISPPASPLLEGSLPVAVTASADAEPVNQDKPNQPPPPSLPPPPQTYSACSVFACWG